MASDRFVLRRTRRADVDFVRRLEQRPENRAFIGRWSPEQHSEAIGHSSTEHWILEDCATGRPAGFVIAFDGRAEASI